LRTRGNCGFLRLPVVPKLTAAGQPARMGWYALWYGDLNKEPFGREGLLMVLASIVVPACNESYVIGRLLSRLVKCAGQDEFEIIVVANGCTDDTAEVARSFGSRVQVLSLAAASKREAVAAGNRAATVFPRVYVDADVELGAGDIRALAAVLGRPGVLAAAPRLRLAMAGTPWPVRWYWDVWTRLPEVRQGLFGRGVVAVSEAGYERIAKLPPVFADDLAASLAFSPGERIIADDACVVVHPPRTFGDLLRIRVRAAMGAAQVEQTEGARRRRRGPVRPKEKK